MKLNRADAVSIGAIACGAFVAIGLTGLVASRAGHHHEVHIEHVEHVDETVITEVGHKDVRVRIRQVDATEVEVVSGDAREGDERNVVRLDGGVRVIRSDGADASSGPQPLVYVDGVRVDGDRERVLQSIDPEQIDRIEVVKGEAAMRLFGDEATGGVIQIFLKDIGTAHPGG